MLNEVIVFIYFLKYFIRKFRHKTAHQLVRAHQLLPLHFAHFANAPHNHLRLLQQLEEKIRGELPAVGLQYLLESFFGGPVGNGGEKGEHEDDVLRYAGTVLVVKGCFAYAEEDLDLLRVVPGTFRLLALL